ncbi:MAG: hypothetical protein R3C42_05025 [Parvularculaceae bacterium]
MAIVGLPASGRLIAPRALYADGSTYYWPRAMSEYLVLGLESSCDDTAAAVIRVCGGEREILSDVTRAQYDRHADYGGVVPETLRARMSSVSTELWSKRLITQAVPSPISMRLQRRPALD